MLALLIEAEGCTRRHRRGRHRGVTLLLHALSCRCACGLCDEHPAFLGNGKERAW